MFISSFNLLFPFRLSSFSQVRQIVNYFFRKCNIMENFKHIQKRDSFNYYQFTIDLVSPIPGRDQQTFPVKYHTVNILVGFFFNISDFFEIHAWVSI